MCFLVLSRATACGNGFASMAAISESVCFSWPPDRLWFALPLSKALTRLPPRSQHGWASSQHRGRRQPALAESRCRGAREAGWQGRFVAVSACMVWVATMGLSPHGERRAVRGSCTSTVDPPHGTGWLAAGLARESGSWPWAGSAAAVLVGLSVGGQDVMGVRGGRGQE